MRSRAFQLFTDG
jgi:alcohol dehydrogenase class IV